MIFPSETATVQSSPDRPPFTLPAELVWQIESLVAIPCDPRDRAAAIAAVVDEICQAAAWLHGADADHEELASLAPLVEAALAHEARMSVLAAGGPR
ncbi:hypothetical protein [uncultured Friedmanniella sp.]|uniref:hypothetical protein n=1 Tax=uncultured Friedmanniella sp. TaxID=335381 RepID=UPI0035CB8124